MFKSNPMNPKGILDERGEAWGVWDPSLVGLPMTPANFQLVQFIKDVYLDSQVTIGLLSNVTALSATPVGERGRSKVYQKIKAKKPRFNNICVHKGLAPGPNDPVRGHPADLPKAAKDWPGLNFHHVSRVHPVDRLPR
jgi:hypothetical protein